jgi:septal ring factor EnvC (AmiA/AmiB activator)
VVSSLTIGGSTALAQDDEERLEELKDEREKIQIEVAAAATKIDAATADFDVVAQALDDINGLVDLQEARLADAQQAVRSAEALVDQAVLRREEIATEMDGLRNLVADLAVAAFTGESGENGEDLTAFLLSDDPTEAVRRRSLVQFQTGNLADALDRMRQLEAEVEQVEIERIRAVDAAVANRTEAIERQGELDLAVDAQLELVLDVEARLENRLAEAQYLTEIDSEKAAEIQQQEEVIAKRIREEAARKAAAEAARRASVRPAPADIADMVQAEGFWVHKDVADAVGRMMRAARSDGVNLSGYSYRSPQRTAELRVINGCPDVYESSPSRCRIPTARPGQSMHERGLAIDFQSCWRGSDCFTWLSNNASKYGYRNLPGESWHWSTNGR